MTRVRNCPCDLSLSYHYESTSSNFPRSRYVGQNTYHTRSNKVLKQRVQKSMMHHPRFCFVNLKTEPVALLTLPVVRSY